MVLFLLYIVYPFILCSNVYFKQEEGTYIQQITTVDGQTVQHLMTGDNQVTEVRVVSYIFNVHNLYHEPLLYSYISIYLSCFRFSI